MYNVTSAIESSNIGVTVAPRNYIRDSLVTVTRGHYKNRPGKIKWISPDDKYCMVVLTDTPQEGDVSINNMTWKDMRKR